jgi:hypothetical protein
MTGPALEKSKFAAAAAAGQKFGLSATAFAAGLGPWTVRQWLQREHVERRHQPENGLEGKFEAIELLRVALLAELAHIACNNIGDMASFTRALPAKCLYDGGPWFYACWSGPRDIDRTNPDAAPRHRMVFDPNAPIAGDGVFLRHDLPALFEDPNKWGVLVVPLASLEERISARLQSYVDRTHKRGRERDE